ncbi:MAG: response regulator [Gammaproteobacteria bacterium]|nr:MAG: response regulator [Gammaproteobacteria bacterium]
MRLPGLTSLRTRALLLGLLPMLLMSLLLGGYLVGARLNDLEQALQSRGQALANELAATAIYGIFSGDTASLRASAKHFLARADVLTIAIRDGDGKTLLRASNPALQRLSSQQHLRHYRFEAPVRGIVSSQPADELAEATGLPEPQPLGEVELTLVDRSYGLAPDVLGTALLIMLGGILVTSLLALIMTRQVTRPIIALSEAIKRLKRGDLSARVEERSTGELRVLEEGFNQMAERVAMTQEELTREVEQMVQDLQTTMDALEVRNIQLDLARKKALAASQAKSDFLAVMSHEIRTPMNGITGFARLLSRSRLDPLQREQVKAIRESADNLLAIVNEILDFSKLESGQLQFHEEPFLIRKMVQGVVTLFSTQAEEKGLKLRSLVYNDVPEAMLGDGLRIRQVLINLVSNAVKFTEQGEVVIRVMLDGDDGEDLITFSVEDTGIGIDPLRGDQLFEPFTQGEVSTERRYGGTGLGLSISKKIVKVLGGGIGFDSSPGEGSTFWFSLPLKPAEIPEEAMSSILSDDPESMLSSSPLSGVRILVADDNAINLELTRAILHSYDAQITAVSDGAQAVREAETHAFDLILMDIHMPVMSGLEAARKIRTGDGASCDCPIIAVTADITAETQKRIFDCGMNEILVKPIDEGKLLLTINSFYQVAQEAPAQQERDTSDEDRPEEQPPVESLQALPLRDRAAALRIAANDETVVERMFGMFLEDLEQALPQMQALKDEGEWRLMWEYNHRLLGAAAACGLPRTHHTLQLIEQALDSEQRQLIDALLGLLAEQTRDLKAER